ncbi:hypothetical protein HDU96_007978, partial [Phlyctochytrium bullatum]
SEAKAPKDHPSKAKTPSTVKDKGKDLKRKSECLDDFAIVQPHQLKELERSLDISRLMKEHELVDILKGINEADDWEDRIETALNESELFSTFAAACLKSIQGPVQEPSFSKDATL